MSDEDINTYKKYISNLDITKYIIKDDEDNYWYSDKYVYQLQTQLEQKENIIKEVREFIYKCNDGKQGINYSGCSKLLEILNKVD